MQKFIKKYIKVSPIYVVLIFNNRHIRWEIFKNNQTLLDVLNLIKLKYKVNTCVVEIYGEIITNYYSKIKSHMLEKNKNGLDIHIFTKNTTIPKEN